MEIDKQIHNMSERAKHILLTVDYYSEGDKFLPVHPEPRGGFFVNFQTENISFYGGGDVKILSSLIAKGFIVKVSYPEYKWFRITEDGRAVAERILELEYYDENGKIIRKDHRLIYTEE